MTTDEKWAELRLQIGNDSTEESPSALYDANELRLMINDYRLDLVNVNRDLSKTKTQLERAERLLVTIQELGLEALYLAIESINQDTHKEKDFKLKTVLLRLRHLIEASRQDLRHDLDSIPF